MQENKELWLPLHVSSWPEIADVYSVSSEGRIRREAKAPGATTGNCLKLVGDKEGYGRVTLAFRGEKKNYLAHRLVAKMFIPNPENHPQINHKNGITNDNRVENMEWVTNSENNKHAVASLGRKSRGGSWKGSRLTKADVDEIKAWWKTGDVSKVELAHKWKVSFNIIKRAIFEYKLSA